MIFLLLYGWWEKLFSLLCEVIFGFTVWELKREGFKIFSTLLGPLSNDPIPFICFVAALTLFKQPTSTQ